MMWTNMTVLAAVLSVVVAAPASAFDLSGTWTGKVTCKGTFNGTPQATTTTSTLLVDDAGSSLALAVDGVHYSAAAYPSATKPEKGEIAVIRCDTNSSQSADFGGEIGRMRVTTNADKGTGSITGSTFRAAVLVARTVGTCHWTFKRTSAAPVALDGCTPPP